MSGEKTKPHDYRVLLDKLPGLTVVGGQAVTAWAITYLDPAITTRPDFGSKDLDVMAKMTVDDIIKALPEWTPQRRPIFSRDLRLLRLLTVNSEGQLLAVEVLSKVRGLGPDDLKGVVEIKVEDTTLHILDPIAVLKAKAANVREINQAGPPPRQDRQHLNIIAKCVAPFLKDAHDQAAGDIAIQADFKKTLSRLFKTLNEENISGVLMAEGIAPMDLIPPEFKDSPIEKIRIMYHHQMPRLAEFLSKVIWPPKPKAVSPAKSGQRTDAS